MNAIDNEYLHTWILVRGLPPCFGLRIFPSYLGGLHNIYNDSKKNQRLLYIYIYTS